MTNRMSIPTIVKTHVANIELGTVRMIPPPLTNKAVYLVRDPRDVCVSFAKHLNKTIDETILYMDNRDFMIFREGSKVASPLTTWSTHVESWERDFVTVIKYEDLKNNPEENFAKILDTFGIKIDKQKLKKSIRLCEIERLKKQEEKQKFIEIGKQDKFFGQGTGWVNTLTEKQIKRIEEDHGEIMQKYGYEFYKKSPHLKSIKTG